ncbi:hypothetical protein CIL05_09935 [Virgibacillus profundi]|uniref:Uncharacterized protein n=1 Tax=Virgibacillus profundi TaxID=2024555 RepID=A0A2A2IF23_9BACI|nr:hypothetical protein [Virgibacillus profundi]PAV29683.1 hypothetical protein CIL05_09935 [Virgibacillus profundi]PXY53855.1 hypothetical protein CIT14_10030 [Virgibacillus profundi]
MRYVPVFFLITLSLLSACSNEVESDAVIEEAELTEFEKNLIELTGDQSFVYDYEINNDEVKEIHTFIDYYEKGELIERVSEMGTTLSETQSDDPMRTVFIRKQVNENEEQWITSIMSNSGSSSADAVNDISKRKEMNSASWGGITSRTPVNIGEKQVVASIVKSNKNGVSTYNIIETEDDLKRATDYEQVYIISIELR